MVPEGWGTRSLGELLDLSSGKRPILIDNAPVPVYGGNGLMGWTADPLRRESTVVIGRVGSPGTVHRTDGPVWVSDNALYVTDLANEVSFDFLPWLLMFERLDHYATRSSHPSLSQRAVSRVRVLLPPLPEQRKIAAILSSVDDAIAATRKVVEQTELVKQGLLQTLMTRGIGHTRFKKTEIGDVPEAWEVVQVESVSAVSSGGTPSRRHPEYFGGAIPWVKSGELSSEITTTEETLTELGLTNSAAKMIPAGAVLVAMYGATAGEVGRLGISATTNQAVAALEPTSVDGGYLYYAVLHWAAQLLRMIQGSGQPNLNQGMVRQMRIPLPTQPEQREIASLLDDVARRERVELRLLGQHKVVKRGLMQDLLTGRVRVRPD